jgi:hypothetical protein
VSIIFISLRRVSRSTSKYTIYERGLIKSLVATLTLKRLSDTEIIKEVERQTNNTMSRSGLYHIKQQIKKESYDWFKQMREGQHEYIHVFKERINEIMDLQKKHHEIIDNDREPTPVKQWSLSELHLISISLSNLYDVAPSIVNGTTLSATPEVKTINTEITV